MRNNLPLPHFFNPFDNVQIGVVAIAEREEAYLQRYPSLQSIYNSIRDKRSSIRRREILASYALLLDMIGSEALTLRHSPSGQPLLSNRFISISHTRGLVTIILATAARVGIDVEYVSDRINNVVSHFMREDEIATATIDRLKIWCAKETLYKLFPELNLTFRDIHVMPTSDNASQGQFTATLVEQNQDVVVNYVVNEQYVLTFSVLPIKQTDDAMR